jgi:hypothetical protein
MGLTMEYNLDATRVGVTDVKFQRLDHVPQGEFGYPKEEIRHLLMTSLLMSEYFEKYVLAASIRLSIDLNESDAK